jgi:hypothetical protein
MLKIRMFNSLPPAERVACRTLGLAALVCRASLEDPSARDDAAAMHGLVLRWVYATGAEKGLSPEELRILETPPGELGREEVALAAWRLEHLSVLAWALGKVALPRANERHQPRWLARKVGFLDDGARRMVGEATLRPPGELLQYSVIIGEIVAHLEREIAASPDRETALALAVAAGRQAAISWLLGEARMEIENRADA